MSRKGRAVHEFVAQSDTELSVKAGDVFYVGDEAGGWTFISLITDPQCEGFIPSWNIEPFDESAKKPEVPESQSPKAQTTENNKSSSDLRNRLKMFENIAKTNEPSKAPVVVPRSSSSVQMDSFKKNLEQSIRVSVSSKLPPIQTDQLPPQRQPPQQLAPEQQTSQQTSQQTAGKPTKTPPQLPPKIINNSNNNNSTIRSSINKNSFENIAKAEQKKAQTLGGPGPNNVTSTPNTVNSTTTATNVPPPVDTSKKVVIEVQPNTPPTHKSVAFSAADCYDDTPEITTPNNNGSTQKGNFGSFFKTRLFGKNTAENEYESSDETKKKHKSLSSMSKLIKGYRDKDSDATQSPRNRDRDTISINSPIPSNNSGSFASLQVSTNTPVTQRTLPNVPVTPTNHQTAIVGQQSPLTPTRQSIKFSEPALMKALAVQIIQRNVRNWLLLKRFREYIRTAPELSKQRIRYNIIKDIVKTEKNYVDSLSIVKKVYLDNLEEKPGRRKILEQKYVEKIFMNVDQIYQVNLMLMNDVKMAWEMFPKCAFGVVFKKMAPFLKVYTTYINNYDEAQATLEKCERKNSRFADFLRRCYVLPECSGLDLAAFLIMPVQRIPRYRLLLDDLLKHTPPDHVEYSALQEALKSIEQIASFMNNGKRVHESTALMVLIQNLVKPRLSELIKPHRKFIRQGRLRISCPSRNLEPEWYTCYLFTDLLVCTSQTDPSRVDMKNCHLMYLSFSSLITSASHDFGLQTLHKGQRTLYYMMANNQEETATWEQILTECVESGAESIKKKGCSDIAEVLSVRAIVSKQVPQIRQELGVFSASLNSLSQKSQKLQTLIAENENKLKNLIAEITRDKQELIESKSMMEEINASKIFLDHKLCEELYDLNESDAVLLVLLNEDADAFKEIFGDLPSCGFPENPSGDKSATPVSQPVFKTRQSKINNSSNITPGTSITPGVLANATAATAGANTTAPNIPNLKNLEQALSCANNINNPIMVSPRILHQTYQQNHQSNKEDTSNTSSPNQPLTHMKLPPLPKAVDKSVLPPPPPPLSLKQGLTVLRATNPVDISEMNVEKAQVEIEELRALAEKLQAERDEWKMKYEQLLKKQGL